MKLSGYDDGLRNTAIKQGRADILDSGTNAQRSNDTTPPAITLLGYDSLSLDQGDTYEEPLYVPGQSREMIARAIVSLIGDKDQDLALGR